MNFHFRIRFKTEENRDSCQGGRSHRLTDTQADWLQGSRQANKEKESDYYLPKIDSVPLLIISLNVEYRYSYSFKETKQQEYYLLTPWSRLLLEKITGLQLVKKFPAFYGTRRFLTALTNARHVYLS
jgi:hypothetical protein